MQSREVDQLFESFRQQTILVIGDVMVDSYLFGTVERISPEAPVPVVNVKERTNRLGGAANVALNLRALGIKPLLCSIVGNDLKGQEFIQLLDDAEIPSNNIIKSNNRITTTKFRVIGNSTQMLRVDEEVTDELNPEDETLLIKSITDTVEKDTIDAIIFQDYDKGVVTSQVIERTIRLARQNNIPVIVDPKRRHFHHYKGATLFKPNLKELREGLNTEVSYEVEGSLEKAADVLHQNLETPYVMITLSGAGIFISERLENGQSQRSRVRAHRRSIADVSGAGDTVVSVAAACFAAGLDARLAAEVANLAGGLVCEEVGVVPVDKDLLISETIKLFG
jgi:rfaE bifunctional protein kinase chain/domain